MNLKRSVYVILVMVGRITLSHSFGSFRRAFAKHVLRQQHAVISDDNNNGDLMVAQHKEKAATSEDTTISCIEDHVLHQKRVFDKMSDFFATKQTIPDELVPVYQHLSSQIVQSAHQTGDSLTEENSRPKVIRVLDVACGTGNLFPFLLETGQQSNHTVQLTGVGVSSKMVEAARRFADEVSSDIEVTESDFLQYTPAQPFDVIVMNACFGNFWNQTSALEYAVTSHLLNETGSIVVSHPLGAEFVQRLQEEDPTTVPHLLPTTKDEWKALIGHLPLKLVSIDLNFGGKPYYFARLQKVPIGCASESIDE